MEILKEEKQEIVIEYIDSIEFEYEKKEWITKNNETIK